MLDLKEIKPGNILSYMDDISYVIVEEVYNDRLKVTKSIRAVQDRVIHIANLTGVKLTQENILSLGFKKSGIWKTMELSPILITEEDNLWYFGNSETLNKNFPIRFIHQLQNLYRDKSGIPLDASVLFQSSGR